MNQPHQGWQQGPYPPQPPKKSNRTALIIMLVIGLVVVLGLGISLFLAYRGANKDGGAPKRNDTLPALCANISEATLAKARTTNPNKALSSEYTPDEDKTTSCAWNQTKGVDGPASRSTFISVTSDAKDAQKTYDKEVEQAKSDTQGTNEQRQLDGIGDQSTAVLMTTHSSFASIAVIARKDDKVVKVEYSGWDAGFLNSKRPDTAAMEAMARTLAEEMISKL